jgi:hypothetical protein
MSGRQTEIDELLNSFADGAGFGDPEARRNAEVRLQSLLALQQQNMSARLNWVTVLQGVCLSLNIVVLLFQLCRR